MYVLYLVLLFFSCNLNTKLVNSSTKDKQKFSLDSLYNINYFDFYGKTFEELLENNIVNQYEGYYPVIEIQGHLSFLQLMYTDETGDFSNYKGLNIYFSRLEYMDEDTLKFGDIPTPIQLAKEKIRKIDFKDRQVLAKTSEEDQIFLKEIEDIDFRKYYGLSVDSLMKIPVLKKWSSVAFDDKKVEHENCLNSVTLVYILSSKWIMLELTPKSFTNTDECVDILDKSWNFNNFRQETLKSTRLFINSK